MSEHENKSCLSHQYSKTFTSKCVNGTGKSAFLSNKETTNKNNNCKILVCPRDRLHATSEDDFSLKEAEELMSFIDLDNIHTPDVYNSPAKVF